MPAAAGERCRRPLSRSWLHTFRSFTRPHSLFDCLVDRFDKPLFNALAPLDSRLSGSQRNANVSRMRDQVCYVLESSLRHCAKSDFLADNELLSDSRSFDGSAPTFADSLAVCYRVSPGETALPFHRKRPAYEAPTKNEKRYAEPTNSAIPSRTRPRCARCCAASTKWAWPAFDDARLLNLNKKRCEADVLRCVRRCQRGEYVFAPYAEIDRFLWHAREPFDDAQRTALSNLCEQSSSAAPNAVDSDAVLAPLKAAGDLWTQGRARAGSVSSRLSTVFCRTVSKPHRRRRRPPPSPLPRAARRLCSASRRRRRQPQEPGPQPSRMPVRRQFNVNEFAAADKQADLETKRRQQSCRVGAQEDAAAPPPPLKQ